MFGKPGRDVWAVQAYHMELRLQRMPQCYLEQSLTFQNPKKIGPKRIDIAINVKEVTFVQEALQKMQKWTWHRQTILSFITK